MKEKSKFQLNYDTVWFKINFRWFVCTILIVLLFLIATPIRVSAKTTYYKIMTLDKNISTNAYCAIRSGKISVSRSITGQWYYKFDWTASSGNQYIVYLSPSAFNSRCTNDTSSINSKLTTNFNGKMSSSPCTYIGKIRSTGSKVISGGMCSVYTMNLFRLSVDELYSSSEIVLDASLVSGCSIEFTSKVSRAGKIQSPSTAADYLNCIKRYKAPVTNIRPTFILDVQNPGSNRTHLAYYEMTGTGYIVNRSMTISNLFSLIVGVGKIVSSAVVDNIKGSISATIGLTQKLYRTETSYSTNGVNQLSVGSHYAAYVNYDSPISLRNIGNKIQIRTTLANPSPDSHIAIKFQIKTK